jgi:hypothetical protein
MDRGYKINKRYGYTKEQSRLIGLQKRYNELIPIKGFGARLQRIGIRMQIKGLLMIMSVNKG